MPDPLVDPVVTGSRRRFAASLPTTAPDAVHRLWTDPSTWGSWDTGLLSAVVAGPFVAGARGELVDRAGRRSRYVVREVAPDRVVVDVRLPLATLRLLRTLHGAAVRHEVTFTGPLSPVFAVVLGGRFRRLLPGTVRGVVAQAEAAPPA